MKKGLLALLPTPNFYSSIGFILAHQTQLLAFIPPKAKKDFWDKFNEATGRDPLPDEQGLVLHPEGTNKFWHECRITFKATERETLRLFLGDDIIVAGQDENHWNINNNNLFFRLLELGFNSGYKQDKQAVQVNIPEEHLQSFLEGYNRRMR